MAGELLDRRVGLKRQRRGDGLVRLDPLNTGARERQEKILKPRSAAELAVRNDLQAGVFQLFELIELQRTRDLAVLVALCLGPGLQQSGGTQQASHVLCTKRRCAHDNLPCAPAPATAAETMTRGDPA